MPIKEESIRQLKERVDLRDVVKEHVSLKKEGSTLKGLCPFHDEKTPSFQVQPDHYHCHGCKAHGDAFDFLRKHTGITFQEAVSSLADKFGVALDYSDAPAEKLPHYDALKKIEKLYSYLLFHTKEGHEALKFLYGRGFDNDDIERFGLGLVPDAEKFWGPFNKLVSGAKPRELGILVKNFEGRIAFPVRDAMGRTIAFSCRKTEGDGAKYVNSPETAVFKKGSVLYGLDIARKRIAKDKSAILAEGQPDVIRLVKEGFSLAVCPLGTSFTKEHVQALKRAGAEKVYIAFDGDKAGRDATIKAGSLLQAEEIEPFVLPMPEGEDCDSLILKEGYPAFEKLLSEPLDFVAFMAKHFLSEYGMTANGKNKACKACSDIINTWDNSIIVKESMRELAKALEVEESDVVPLFHDKDRNPPANINGALPAEKRVLCAILHNWVNSIFFFSLKEEDFCTPICSKMFSLFNKSQDKLENELEKVFHENGLGDDYTHLRLILPQFKDLQNFIQVIKSLRKDVLLHKLKQARNDLNNRSSNQDISEVYKRIKTIETQLKSYNKNAIK